MKRIRILVFPCGSEIGLEVYRSLKFSKHIELIGGSSVDDHGKFVYENYIGDIPSIESDRVIKALKKIVHQNKIDAVYPAMDKVIWKLKVNEKEIGCRVIAPNEETTEICMSKNKTYKIFDKIIKVPEIFQLTDPIKKYPLFVKPNIGYGSQDTFKLHSSIELQRFFEKRNQFDYVITEYLPNEEFTIDCFTDRYGELRFCGPRYRKRISNGISVNTTITEDTDNLFYEMANKINDTIKLQGAWFFQVKKDSNNVLTLLEIACRLGGSSALYRSRGVNFALLSIYDAFDINVTFIINTYKVELDRALDIKYKIGINYSTIYIDFDDCLIIDSKVNYYLLAFIYKEINKRKKIVLITKHENDIKESLKRYRLETVFDKVIKISKGDEKSKYISDPASIFIDDSFAERKKIFLEKKIPVFAPDMIECLL